MALDSLNNYEPKQIIGLELDVPIDIDGEEVSNYFLEVLFIKIPGGSFHKESRPARASSRDKI